MKQQVKINTREVRMDLVFGFFFVCVCEKFIEGLSETQNRQTGPEVLLWSPSNKQCLKGCALCTSIMEREFKLPAWNGQNVVLLSIIRAVSDFSPLEKHIHHPITFVFLLLQLKQKKRSLGSNDKTRKARWAEIFVSKSMLLLDFAELVNSLIYSYCWSFLCGFFFFFSCSETVLISPQEGKEQVMRMNDASQIHIIIHQGISA